MAFPLGDSLNEQTHPCGKKSGSLAPFVHFFVAPIGTRMLPSGRSCVRLPGFVSRFLFSIIRNGKRSRPRPAPPITPPGHDKAGSEEPALSLREGNSFKVLLTYHFIAAKRRAASSALRRLLKAEMRKYPSPALPKPLPGVMTMLASLSTRSKMSQLVAPCGPRTQM